MTSVGHNFLRGRPHRADPPPPVNRRPQSFDPLRVMEVIKGTCASVKDRSRVSNYSWTWWKPPSPTALGKEVKTIWKKHMTSIRSFTIFK